MKINTSHVATFGQNPPLIWNTQNFDSGSYSAFSTGHGQSGQNSVSLSNECWIIHSRALNCFAPQVHAWHILLIATYLAPLRIKFYQFAKPPGPREKKKKEKKSFPELQGSFILKH